MRVGRLLLLLILLIPAGCSFFYYGAQSTISDPYDAAQECAFRNRIRRIAHETWRTIRKDDPKSYSTAYAKGFADGFVEFVDGDGTGEPPAVAPIHLRRKLLQSEAGQIEIDDWYAGYRHGVLAARATGLREKYLMPIALPPKPPQEPVPAQVVVPIPAADPVEITPQPMPIVTPARPLPK
jgi:hypothetical protein